MFWDGAKHDTPLFHSSASSCELSKEMAWFSLNFQEIFYYIQLQQENKEQVITIKVEHLWSSIGGANLWASLTLSLFRQTWQETPLVIFKCCLDLMLVEIQYQLSINAANLFSTQRSKVAKEMEVSNKLTNPKCF